MISRNKLSSSIKHLVVTGAAALAVAGAPLLAQHISVDYDHSASFGQMHTYTIGQIHTSDPLFADRVRDEINRDLQARGWQMVPEGGDVTVVAIGNVRDQAEYSTFYEGLGPGWGWRRGWGGGGFGETYTTVNQVPMGTLVIDMYQTGEHKLLFRGMASEDISTKSEKNIGKVNKSVDKILMKVPR